VYCVRQIVKTSTIICNNPVYNRVKDVRIAGTCLPYTYAGQVHFGCMSVLSLNILHVNGNKLKYSQDPSKYVLNFIYSTIAA